MGGDNNGEKVIFKNSAPFTDYISEISKTQVDNSDDIDIVIPMYNLIERIDNSLKASGRLWQYYSDQPFLNNAGAVVDFTGVNKNSKQSKCKQNITIETDVNNTKIFKILVPLKYLSNFWKNIEISLINCEISLILTWSEKCVIAPNTVLLKI